MPPEARRGRWWAAIAVLAVHGLLLTWGSSMRPGSRLGVATTALPLRHEPVWVQHLPPLPPDRQPQVIAGHDAARRPAFSTPPRRAAVPALEAAARPRIEQAASHPTQDANARLTGPAQKTPAPLRLLLPQGFDAPRSARDMALRDPRSNAPPLPAGEALATLAGRHTALVETGLAGEGRRRVLLRGRCFDVHDARITQLDPFNASVLAVPKQVRPCRE